MLSLLIVIKKYDDGIAYNGRSISIFMEIGQLVPNFKWGHAQKHDGLISLLFPLRKESGLKMDLNYITYKHLNGLNLFRI
jgi:hypothetical protein